MEQATDTSLSKEHTYPQTDREIRMWCVEMAFEFLGRNNIEDAEKLYDFIIGRKKEERQELKS